MYPIEFNLLLLLYVRSLQAIQLALSLIYNLCSSFVFLLIFVTFFWNNQQTVSGNVDLKRMMQYVSWTCKRMYPIESNVLLLLYVKSLQAIQLALCLEFAFVLFLCFFTYFLWHFFATTNKLNKSNHIFLIYTSQF